jgi:hypothetical protein
VPSCGQGGLMPGDGGVGLHRQEKGLKPELQGVANLLVVFEDNLSPVPVQHHPPAKMGHQHPLAVPPIAGPTLACSRGG